ncbi:MAG: hypothetical protein ACR2JU_07300 [Nocardioidaceae bacterium]
MRAYRIWIAGGLVLLVLLAGFACIVSVKYGSAPRTPWWLLGIALIAFGAAGALATTVMKAMQMETEEEHPSDDDSSATSASGSA